VTEQDSAPTQGMTIDRKDEDAFMSGLEAVVDYRGDVTLVLNDDAELDCFVFSRTTGGEDALLCMFKGEDQTRTVPIDTIREIRFSGKDTAHGKSFERWIERYIEKKLAGETASIESESLDDE